MRVLIDTECTAVAGGDQSECVKYTTYFAIAFGAVIGAIAGASAGGMGAVLPGAGCGCWGQAHSCRADCGASHLCKVGSSDDSEESDDDYDSDEEEEIDGAQGPWVNPKVLLSNGGYQPDVIGPEQLYCRFPPIFSGTIP